MDITIDRRSPWDLLWNQPTLTDLRGNHLTEGSPARHRANAVDAQIRALNTTSEERILEEYGAIQHPRPATYFTRPWGGNLNVAKESFVRASRERAYHAYKLRASVLTFVYATSAVPALITRCALQCVHIVCATPHQPPFSFHLEQLNHAAQLIFLSTIVGLKSLALTLLIDPIVLFYRKCLRDNHRIGMLIIDPQLSFFPRPVNARDILVGTLATQASSQEMLTLYGAWEAIEPINRLQQAVANQGGVIVSSFQDHPLTHGATIPMLRTVGSTTLFGQEQTAWPVHCVHRSEGWHYAPTLNTDLIRAVFPTGQRPWVDNYSAFRDHNERHNTLLTEYLQEICGVSQLFVVGFAYGFGVGFSALDAQREGFETTVVTDATAATTGIPVPDPAEPELLISENAAMHHRLQAAQIRQCSLNELLRHHPRFISICA